VELGNVSQRFGRRSRVANPCGTYLKAGGGNIKINAGRREIHSRVWWEHLWVIHDLGNL
jgi:hypothetical protein